jgi:uncharacterized membrane protein
VSIDIVVKQYLAKYRYSIAAALAVLIVLLVVYAVLSSSNTPKPVYGKGIIHVRVFDSNGQPIPRAMVLISGAGSYSTDVNGECMASVLAPADYTIYAFADGYDRQTSSVHVAMGGNITIDVYMHKSR